LEEENRVRATQKLQDGKRHMLRESKPYYLSASSAGLTKLEHLEKQLFKEVKEKEGTY